MENSTNVEHSGAVKEEESCAKVDAATPGNEAALQGPDGKVKSSSKVTYLASVKNSEGQS
jgi:hypothetical protein